jgi:hypothetical protein
VSRSIDFLVPARWLRCIPFSSALALFAASALVLAGCERAREVSVRVSIPGPDSLEAPAAGVAVIALPYDRDSVLASLEARARRPRPHTATLDRMFQRFRGPFTAYTNISYAAGELRDSLARLRTLRDSLPRSAPKYHTLSTRIDRLSDSLSALESRGERARVMLDRARAEFVSRSESLRAAVRQWEDSTYQGYDSIVEHLAKTRGREAATDTTGATGWAHLSLKSGPWWIYARAWDTSDPNAEWYWNLPVQDDTMLLSSRTGQRRPRY